jgi:hypothetical protein
MPAPRPTVVRGHPTAATAPIVAVVFWEADGRLHAGVASVGDHEDAPLSKDAPRLVRTGALHELPGPFTRLDAFAAIRAALPAGARAAAVLPDDPTAARHVLRGLAHAKLVADDAAPETDLVPLGPGDAPAVQGGTHLVVPHPPIPRPPVVHPFAPVLSVAWQPDGTAHAGAVSLTVRGAAPKPSRGRDAGDWAGRLDGAGAVVSAAVAGLASPGGLTVAVDCLPTSTSGEQWLVASDGFRVGLLDGTPFAAVLAGGSWWTAEAAGPVDAGRWVQLQAAWAEGTLTLALDGVAAGSVPTPPLDALHAAPTVSLGGAATQTRLGPLPVVRGRGRGGSLGVWRVDHGFAGALGAVGVWAGGRLTLAAEPSFVLGGDDGVTDLTGQATVLPSHVAAAPGPQPGQTGFFLDGSTASVSISAFPRTALLLGGFSFSVEVMPDVPGESGVIADLGPIALALANGRLEVTAGAATIGPLDPPLPSRQWTEVAVTAGGGELTLFVDGVPVGTTTSQVPTLQQLGQTVRFGAAASGARKLRGYLASPQLWRGDHAPQQPLLALDVTPAGIVERGSAGASWLLGRNTQILPATPAYMISYDPAGGVSTTTEVLRTDAAFTVDAVLLVDDQQARIAAGGFSFSLSTEGASASFVVGSRTVTVAADHGLVSGMPTRATVVYDGHEAAVYLDGDEAGRGEVGVFAPSAPSTGTSVTFRGALYSLRVRAEAVPPTGTDQLVRTWSVGGLGSGSPAAAWTPSYTAPRAGDPTFAGANLQPALADWISHNSTLGQDRTFKLARAEWGTVAESSVASLAAVAAVAATPPASVTGQQVVRALVPLDQYLTQQFFPRLHSVFIAKSYGRNGTQSRDWDLSYDTPSAPWRQQFTAAGGNLADVPTIDVVDQSGSDDLATISPHADTLTAWEPDLHAQIAAVRDRAIASSLADALQIVGYVAEADQNLLRGDDLATAASALTSARSLLDRVVDVPEATSQTIDQAIAAVGPLDFKGTPHTTGVALDALLSSIREYVPFALNAVHRANAASLDPAQAGSEYAAAVAAILDNVDQLPFAANAALTAWVAVAQTHLEQAQSLWVNGSVEDAVPLFRAVLRRAYAPGLTVDAGSPLDPRVARLWSDAAMALGRIDTSVSPFGLSLDYMPSESYATLSQLATTAITSSIDVSSAYVQAKTAAEQGLQREQQLEQAVSTAQQQVTAGDAAVDTAEAAVASATAAVAAAQMALTELQEAGVRAAIGGWVQSGLLTSIKSNASLKLDWLSIAGALVGVVSSISTSYQDELAKAKQAVDAAKKQLADAQKQLSDATISSESAHSSLQLLSSGLAVVGNASAEMTATWWFQQARELRRLADNWVDEALSAVWLAQQAAEKVTDNGYRPIDWSAVATDVDPDVPTVPGAPTLSDSLCATSSDPFAGETILAGQRLSATLYCIDSKYHASVADLLYDDKTFSLRDRDALQLEALRQGRVDGSVLFSLSLRELESTWPGQAHLMVGNATVEIHYEFLAGDAAIRDTDVIRVAIDGGPLSYVRLPDAANVYDAGVWPITDAVEWLPAALVPAGHLIKAKTHADADGSIDLDCVVQTASVTQQRITVDTDATFLAPSPAQGEAWQGVFQGSGLCRDWTVSFRDPQPSWFRWERIGDVVLRFSAQTQSSGVDAAGTRYERSPSLTQAVAAALPARTARTLVYAAGATDASGDAAVQVTDDDLAYTKTQQPALVSLGCYLDVASPPSGGFQVTATWPGGTTSVGTPRLTADGLWGVVFATDTTQGAVGMPAGVALPAQLSIRAAGSAGPVAAQSVLLVVGYDFVRLPIV